MTNQDHIWHILDDVLLLLAGQHYPTPERTYKLDGGWPLALADLKRCFADLRAKLAAVEGELDAAQAGEARAVEALQNLRIPLAQLGDFSYSPVRDASQELLAIVNSVLANTYTQPALDWLDQQRAEAVAAWIEKEATKCRQQNGEYYERSVEGMLEEAAALRTGEAGNE